MLDKGPFRRQRDPNHVETIVRLRIRMMAHPGAGHADNFALFPPRNRLERRSEVIGTTSLDLDEGHNAVSTGNHVDLEAAEPIPVFENLPPAKGQVLQSQLLAPEAALVTDVLPVTGIRSDRHGNTVLPTPRSVRIKSAHPGAKTGSRWAWGGHGWTWAGLGGAIGRGLRIVDRGRWAMEWLLRLLRLLRLQA